MPDLPAQTPAELAAEKALREVYSCIDQRKSFVLEAGAGAGKTYSLIHALRYIIDKHKGELLRNRQRVACITFTNVATDEIKSRTDSHPVVHADTIHAYCWSLIKDFQPVLREEVPKLDGWPERLSDAGGMGMRSVQYNLGYPSVDEAQVLLHHNDILALTVALLKRPKFRSLLTERYPIILIDEYQDTDRMIVEALDSHFLGTNGGPLIGFFGDHWQKIYGNGCGAISSTALYRIGKEANFRSVPAVVDALNAMRPELPQAVRDPAASGSVQLFHTNSWTGERLTGQHWGGDLPPNISHDFLGALCAHLTSQGWEFSPDKTKILMLTHRVLANEQGYSNLSAVFPFNDSFLKKEDPYIAFFADTFEPMAIAYSQGRFGDMFAALGGATPTISCHSDKVQWAKDMGALLSLRDNGTIGAVIDYIRQANRPRLPDSIERRERRREQLQGAVPEEEVASLDRLNRLREVSYREVIALTRFIDGHTPFATKHGVKGAEFDNVLVVLGRGWNQYNFSQMLEWAGGQIPEDKIDAFHRNRNLFYVACSRPKTRLALLFTQKLSDKALNTLRAWFGAGAIHPLSLA